MANVFISYAREDFQAASEIYDNLAAQGYTIWMDKKSLIPGQEWELEIEQAIRNSDVFVACLSNHSVNKTGYVQAELKKALKVAELMPEGKIFIIPVRLDDCQVPHKLESLHWMDYFEAGSQGSLLKAIQSKVSAEASLEKELREFLLHNGPENVGERFQGVPATKITQALLSLTKREDEALQIRSRAVRGLSILNTLDRSTWSEIIPTASTELLAEWLQSWGEADDSTILEAEQISALFASRRLPNHTTGLGKAVRKFIERGAGYTSEVFLPGSKYPFWEVKYDCVRTVIALDDQDSLRVLASFSTMSYWKARRRIIDYIEGKYAENRLPPDEIEIAIGILRQISSDGKTDENTPTLSKARKLLEKILADRAGTGKAGVDKRVSAKPEQFFDAGERLKMVRNELRLETSEFIELTGVASQREYEMIENRKNEAPVSLLEIISQVSGVNLEWLKHGKGHRFGIEAVYLSSIEKSLKYCADLKPQEYFLTLNKKSLHVGLIAQTRKYRYQVIETGVTLDFWNWVDSHWVISAFYNFLDKLSGPWHDIDGVVLPPQSDDRLFKGEIHFITALANAERYGGDLLYDLLDIDETRGGISSYSTKYGGNWMPRVHAVFREYLKPDTMR